MLTKDYKKRPSISDILKKDYVQSKADFLQINLKKHLMTVKRYNSTLEIINEKENKK